MSGLPAIDPAIPLLPEEQRPHGAATLHERMQRLLSEFGEQKRRADLRARDCALSALLLESEDARRKKSREALELYTESTMWGRAMEMLSHALTEETR